MTITGKNSITTIKPFTQVVKDNWLLLGFAVQLILTFGFIQTTVQENSDRIEKLEDAGVQDALTISQINSRLASIETSLIFIEKALR